MIESLRDLRLFVAAYEERSFTLAAERENATQSGVSQRIKTIEERFGVELFARTKGRVSPTPAGDVYYGHCVEILRLNDAASRTLAGHAKTLSGEINVGLMPTMTRSCLAPALARFVDQFPNVTVRLDEAYSGVLTQRVLAGELDFAIVPALLAVPGLQVRRFLRTVETLVSRRDSTLTHLMPIRPRDVGPLRLIVPGPANTRRQTVITYLTTHSVVVDRHLEIDAMMGTLDLVSRSQWTTILPGLMMDPYAEPHPYTVNPIVDPVATVDLVVIEPSRRGLSPAASAFFVALEAEATNQNRFWARYLER